MKKTLLLVAGVLVLVLALSGTALAASPQDIYNDFAQDQKLDGNYTDAELEAYLGDAAVRQYGDPAIIAALDAVVKGILASKGDTGPRDKFPFTGAHLLLMAIGAAALVGGGTALHRVGKRRD